jgi:hypothetical protein
VRVQYVPPPVWQEPPPKPPKPLKFDWGLGIFIALAVLFLTMWILDPPTRKSPPVTCEDLKEAAREGLRNAEDKVEFLNDVREAANTLGCTF